MIIDPPPFMTFTPQAMEAIFQAGYCMVCGFPTVADNGICGTNPVCVVVRRNIGPDCKTCGHVVRAGQRYCASCQRGAKRLRSTRGHAKRVENTYGLLPGEYDALYEAQGGKCAICQRATGRSKRLAVDHDHQLEGRESVRGLLCSTDNRMLGHGRDDLEFFLRVVGYLQNPPAREVLL